jgi:hypothetical protein
VTLCHQDNEPGTGSLDSVLQLGGLIRFACAPATIQITHTHVLKLPTIIDGGGGITFDAGSRALTMFQAGAPGMTLTLMNFTAINGVAANPGGGLLYAPASVVHSGFSPNVTLNLDSIEIINSDRPVYLNGGQGDFLNVQHTQFLNTRGPAVLVSGVEGQARISNSSFAGAEQGIFVGGSVTVTGTPFAASKLSAVSIASGASAEISYCDFSNNAGTDGAAIAIDGKARSVSILGSTFTNNTASGSGGAIAVFPFRRLTSLPPPPGAVSVQMKYLTFTGNRAATGGAVAANLTDGGSALLQAGLFQSNTASGDGGGLFSESGVVTGNILIFKENTAGKRGSALMALSQPAHPAELGNILAVSNQAASGGGAVSGTNLLLQNATVVDNTNGGVGSTDRGGLPAGAISGSNNIIARNSGSNCVSPFVSQAANLQFPAGSCGTATVAEPALDAMYAPLPGSAAYGSGQVAVCLGPVVSGRDVFFQKRGTQQVCSIGAIEYAPENYLVHKAIRESVQGSQHQ